MPPPPVYLDNAATSHPKPRAVRDALVNYYDRVAASAGRGAYQEASTAGEVLDACRAGLARLLKVPDPDRIVFTLNCTDALNLGLKGVLKNGDHVVTTWMDHNSILRPLARMEAEGLIRVTRCKANPTGCVTPDAIKEAIEPDTRMVAMVHASNVSGSLNDARAVGKICQEARILFLLDAAQTVGAMPLDPQDLGIDLLAFPGHKGLMGPLGTGALWMSDRIEVRSIREGGTGSKSEEDIQPTFLPDRLEAGSHNLLGLAGLRASVDYILDVGLEKILDHKRRLMVRFLESIIGKHGIRLHGPSSLDSRVAVFSVTLPGWDVMDAGQVLDREYGIKVRSGLHCAPLAHQTLGTHRTGTIRLSPGFFTTLEDMDRAAAALSALARHEGASTETHA